MSKANIKGRTFLFDTFSGFKKNDGIHKKETFYFDDISLVKKNIIKLKLKKISVHKSHFPRKLKFPINKVKLCHIDVNTYESTKEVFEFVDKKLIKGGMVIFDDFGTINYRPDIYGRDALIYLSLFSFTVDQNA